MEQTLVLNATYEPLQIVSWKRAVRMLCLEKVEVVEAYSSEIHSIAFSIRMPAVVRLRHYVNVKRFHFQVPLSRQNLFSRDHYRCQYCGEDFSIGYLTYDHVIPVARGGSKTWDNIVTCCILCNRKKGNRTPDEAGFRLQKPPRAPVGFPTKVHILLARMQAPEAWKEYIFGTN